MKITTKIGIATARNKTKPAILSASRIDSFCMISSQSTKISDFVCGIDESLFAMPGTCNEFDDADE